MTAERHAAYCQAKSQLNDLSTSKLLPAERTALYEAADDLLLTNDPVQARRAFEQAESQLRALVDTGRWTQTMAEPLLDALARTGAVVALVGAA
jgi:hypothetical protein